MHVRTTTLLPLLLLAACTAAPPPADPLTLAANAREQAKLLALAECQQEARAIPGRPLDDEGVSALVDLCMERRGYWRDTPVAELP